MTAQLEGMELPQLSPGDRCPLMPRQREEGEHYPQFLAQDIAAPFDTVAFAERHSHVYDEAVAGFRGTALDGVFTHLYEASPNTAHHGRNVAKLMIIASSHLGLSEEAQVHSGRVGLVHDIAKFLIAGVVDSSEVYSAEYRKFIGGLHAVFAEFMLERMPGLTSLGEGIRQSLSGLTGLHHTKQQDGIHRLQALMPVGDMNPMDTHTLLRLTDILEAISNMDLRDYIARQFKNGDAPWLLWNGSEFRLHPWETRQLVSNALGLDLKTSLIAGRPLDNVVEFMSTEVVRPVPPRYTMYSSLGFISTRMVSGARPDLVAA